MIFIVIQEEPCIRITKQHFPNMKHLGDITKIHGDEIEPVDVITGGSPCQDLSIAGKQSGIKLKCDNCETLVEFVDSIHSCPNCGSELNDKKVMAFDKICTKVIDRTKYEVISNYNGDISLLDLLKKLLKRDIERQEY